MFNAEAVSVTSVPFGGLSLPPFSSFHSISIVYSDEETPSLSLHNLIKGERERERDKINIINGNSKDLGEREASKERERERERDNEEDLSGTPLGNDLDASALAGMRVIFGGKMIFVPLEGSVIAVYEMTERERSAVAVCSRMEVRER